MRRSRTTVAVCGVVLLLAGCGSTAASKPAGAAGGNAAAPTVNLDAATGDSATGELHTTGAVTGTWRWKEGLDIRCSDIGLALDGSDGLGYVSVTEQGEVGFGTGVVRHGPFGGKGGKIDLSFNTGPGHLARGTMTLDHVTVIGDDGSTITIDGSLAFTC
jgi:hypothetical protein